VCVGNLASRFSAKLVHIFLSTYVVDNLRQHSDDLKQFDDEVNNVSVCIILCLCLCTNILGLIFALPSRRLPTLLLFHC